MKLFYTEDEVKKHDQKRKAMKDTLTVLQGRLRNVRRIVDHHHVHRKNEAACCAWKSGKGFESEGL